EVCARWAKSAAPAWRLRLRQEAAVKTGADFRVRNTAAGAVCQQTFHDARCECWWRFDRRADRDFRETLQNPRPQQGARVCRVNVTNSRARELRRKVKRDARSFEIISCVTLGRKFTAPAFDFMRARAVGVPFGFDHDCIR